MLAPPEITRRLRRAGPIDVTALAADHREQHLESLRQRSRPSGHTLPLRHHSAHLESDGFPTFQFTPVLTGARASSAQFLRPGSTSTQFLSLVDRLWGLGAMEKTSRRREVWAGPVWHGRCKILTDPDPVLCAAAHREWERHAFQLEDTVHFLHAQRKGMGDAPATRSGTWREGDRRRVPSG